jgi:hypothetical protein
MYANTRAPLAAPNHPHIDALLGNILALPPAQLDELCHRLAGHPQLAEAGWRLSERRQYGERNPDRNAEIRQRHREGMTYGQLALQPYGLTKSAIAKICQRVVKAESVDISATSTTFMESN